MKRRVHDPAVSAWAYNLMLEALRARMPPGGADAGPSGADAPRAARAGVRRRAAGAPDAAPAARPPTARAAVATRRATCDAPQLAQRRPDEGGEPGGER